MVETILTERQLSRLKDAGQKDSPDRAALGEGEYFSSDVKAPVLISVEIRAAIDRRCPSAL